jgi:hypothetical protein
MLWDTMGIVVAIFAIGIMVLELLEGSEFFTPDKKYRKSEFFTPDKKHRK